MMLAAALALLLAAAPPDLLAEARDAFTAGDYARAERLALQAAAPEGAPERRAPGAGSAARYLVGLARFRAGRPAEALQALDAAEAGADSPAAWHFNRGACLSELGRSQEAEAEFLEAARDPAFEPLALVEAGWAALASDEVERARGHAERARAVVGSDRAASPPQAEPLVAALEQALSAGGKEPEAPPLPAVAGASFASALPASPGGWELGVRAGGGWDGDALHTETGWLERPGVGTATAPSAFLTAAGWAAERGRLLGGWAEGSYAFSQLAYLASDAKDQSLQGHDLTLAYRWSPRPALWLEGGLSAQLALAGLDDFRPMQSAAGARLTASLETSPRTATLAEVAWTGKRGHGAEFSYLGGDRLEGTLAEQVSWDGFTIRAGYRYQRELIGVLTSALPLEQVIRLCPPGPGGALACTAGEAVEPLSYVGSGAFGFARLPLAPWLQLDLDGSLQWRDYLHDGYLLLTRSDGGQQEVQLPGRHDTRWSTGAAATVSLRRGLSITLRYGWVGSVYGTTARPGMGPGSPMDHGASPGTGSWDKQVLQLGVTLIW